MMGLGHLGLQQFEKARIYFSRALELDVDHQGVRVHLEVCLKELEAASGENGNKYFSFLKVLTTGITNARVSFRMCGCGIDRSGEQNVPGDLKWQSVIFCRF